MTIGAADVFHAASVLKSTCLSLPGASGVQCNFDPAFTPGALADRIPPRADWPEAAKRPL